MGQTAHAYLVAEGLQFRLNLSTFLKPNQPFADPARDHSLTDRSIKQDMQTRR